MSACLFFCFFISAFQTVLSIATEQSHQYFVSIEGNSRSDSEGKELAVYTTDSAIRCALRCQRQQDCKIIDYDMKTEVCRLGEMNLRIYGGTSLTMRKMDSVTENPKSIDEEVFLSCRDVIEKRRSQGNGAYRIRSGSSVTMTYCHMDDLQACGGGGWTLAMKVDGTKPTLRYNASHWTQPTPMSTENGLDLNETSVVLPTYWATPLTKICLGAKQVGENVKWLKLTLKASAISLMNVISGSDKLPFQALSVDDWTAAFGPAGASIAYSTTQGVSLEVRDVKVRLGLAWDDASGATGFMGIGSYDNWGGHAYQAISCGFGYSSFGGLNIVPSFCYVFVQ